MERERTHYKSREGLFFSSFTQEPHKCFWQALLAGIGKGAAAAGKGIVKGAATAAKGAAKGAATGAKAVGQGAKVTGQTAYKGAKAAYKSDFVQKEVIPELKSRVLSGGSRVETQAERSGIQAPVQENQQKVKLYGLQESGNPLHYGTHMAGKKVPCKSSKPSKRGK
jgi:hypothetical protein